MTKPLFLGSLFDGVGGFPLAAIRAGIIQPKWASEIEPFGIAVTSARIPQMTHYGDLKANASSILEACHDVDIVSMGSPCQDLSIAGERKGLSGSKSSLLLDAMGILTRAHSYVGSRLRWIVWENVSNSLSSNSGEDFYQILKLFAPLIGVKPYEITRLTKWPKAGCILGRPGSLAWRILDAKHWGVPQSRRRIYLVADLRDGSAPKVLFNESQRTIPVRKSRTIPKNDSRTVVHSASETSPRLDLYSASQFNRVPKKVNVSPTILSSLGAAGGRHPLVTVAKDRVEVRRITPNECKRLQGFPDYWDENIAVLEPTYNQMRFWRKVFDEDSRIRGIKDKTDSQILKWLKNPYSDSAAYKAYGNAIAIPCAEYVFKQIQYLTTTERKNTNGTRHPRTPSQPTQLVTASRSALM